MQSHAPMRRDRKPLLEYPLLVLVGWVWYLQRSGDVAFLHRGYAPFQRLLEVVLAHRDEHGFFRHPVFTPHLGGPIGKEGTTCAVQALLVRVWRDWAWVERRMARPQAAAAAEARADELSDAIRREGAELRAELEVVEGEIAVDRVELRELSACGA